MRRVLRSGFFAVVAISGIAQAGVVTKHGALKVVGNHIVDAGGNPIQVAGMSLYWSTFGTNQTWGANKLFNTNVVTTMANDWKSSLIRAPAGVITGTGTNVYNYPATMNLVKQVVDAAIAQDIYVIVDWHLENSTPDLANATQFFTEMTQTYKNTPNIIWEIWNEPKGVAWSEIKSYANTMIPLIRKKSSNLIVVGTPNWSHNPDQAALDPITIDPNIAYTLHFYANQNANNAIDADNNTVLAAANKAIQTIPLFITEWGTVGNSGAGVVNTAWSDKWLAWAKSNGVSWANWSLSDKDESSAALLPGASGNGGWSDANLSPSGTYVKAKIKDVFASISAGGGVIVDPTDPPKADTISLPGKFEAEKASTLSSGIQIETTSDAGGGSALGYTTNGTADYTVKVSQSGSYILRARVATDESGTMTFKLGGNQIGTITASKTGGWQAWQTMETRVQLNAGANVLQVGWSGAVNLNWIEIASEANAVLRSPTGNSGFSVRSTSTGLDLQLPGNAREVSVSDLRGHIDSYRILSGERELKLASSRSGLLIVKVTTRDGTHTATVAPLR